MILVKGLQRYQRLKLEVAKNIGQHGRPQVLGFKPGWLADIFFDLQLQPLISLQPLDQIQCLVPHLKDLLCICLELKAQGIWMTFKVCNLGSNYPYLLDKMGFVDSLTHTSLPWSARCPCDLMILELPKVIRNISFVYNHYNSGTKIIMYQNAKAVILNSV